MNIRLLVCVALARAHTCLQFMTGHLKRELIKTKYVCLTVLPLHPESAESCGGVSGSCLPCWKALRGNQKRMTEWKRPFRQWAQKTCKKRGRRMEGKEARGGGGEGWGVGGGRRFQEERDRERDTQKGEKKHEKRVWGAPAYQVTPDLGPLCHPSARLSGGFVGASMLNGHPADRHVVYPLCVLWGRERLLSVCTSSEKQVDNVSMQVLTSRLFFFRLQHI